MLWRNLWTYFHYGSGLTIGACSLHYLTAGIKPSKDAKPKKHDSRRPFMK